MSLANEVVAAITGTGTWGAVLSKVESLVDQAAAGVEQQGEQDLAALEKMAESDLLSLITNTILQDLGIVTTGSATPVTTDQTTAS